jgi:hypothetical protein
VDIPDNSAGDASHIENGARTCAVRTSPHAAQCPSAVRITILNGQGANDGAQVDAKGVEAQRPVDDLIGDRQ